MAEERRAKRGAELVELGNGLPGEFEAIQVIGMISALDSGGLGKLPLAIQLRGVERFLIERAPSSAGVFTEYSGLADNCRQMTRPNRIAPIPHAEMHKSACKACKNWLLYHFDTRWNWVRIV